MYPVLYQKKIDKIDPNTTNIRWNISFRLLLSKYAHLGILGTRCRNPLSKRGGGKVQGLKGLRIDNRDISPTSKPPRNTADMNRIIRTFVVRVASSCFYEEGRWENSILWSFFEFIRIVFWKMGGWKNAVWCMYFIY